MKIPNQTNGENFTLPREIYNSKKKPLIKL